MNCLNPLAMPLYGQRLYRIMKPNVQPCIVSSGREQRMLYPIPSSYYGPPICLQRERQVTEFRNNYDHAFY